MVCSTLKDWTDCLRDVVAAGKPYLGAIKDMLDQPLESAEPRGRPMI